MAGKRRRFSAQFKAKVAIKAIKGQQKIAELAGRYQVHPDQITQWKKQLLSAAEQAFSSPIVAYATSTYRSVAPQANSNA